MILILSFFVFFKIEALAAEITATPSLRLKVEYDDNIDFTSKDETGDFSGSAIPGLRFNYLTELLEFNAYGEVDFKRYFDETDFNRTNQLYGIDSKYQMLERLYFLGEFEFKKDETPDSQLEETGRIFERDRRTRYNASGGLRYQISELSEIGPNFEYEKTDFSGQDDDDYNVYRYSLPYSKKFKNQRDTLILTPFYTDFDSDTQDVNGYRFQVDWQHLIGETITSNISAGVRYTRIDRDDSDGTDSSWGGLGKLDLTKMGETYNGTIGYSHDLGVDADGEIIQIDRGYLDIDKKLLERFGLRFNGSAYYTRKESGDKEKVRYFVLTPSAYYELAENHTLELFYSYQNEVEMDEPGNPTTQRNRVWLDLRLAFPKKW
jgi:hypothetical protein